jgi:hypothetical protein
LANQGQLVTVDGEVVGVDRTPPADALGTGARLTLRADGAKNVTIELAPGWWLDEQGIRFSPTERIEVVGARAPEGRGDIVAWELRGSEHSLRLRDSRGRPLWPAKPGAR